MAQKQLLYLRQDQIPIHSSLIQSCLPRSETFLRKHLTEILAAYEWDFDLTKNMEYRSTLDMVLCNLIPYHKKACKKHYKNSKFHLDTLYSKPALDNIDLTILRELEGMVKLSNRT